MLRLAILGSALLLALTGKVASAEPGEGQGASEGKASQARAASGADEGGEGAEAPAIKTRHSANGVSVKKHGKFTGQVCPMCSANRRSPAVGGEPE